MIQSTHQLVCTGCGVLGPAAATRVLAWQTGREQGWTLTRATAEHWCPSCSAHGQVADDAEAADVDAAVAELTADAARPCTCGRPRYPDHDGGAPGPTVRHPYTPAP